MRRAVLVVVLTAMVGCGGGGGRSPSAGRSGAMTAEQVLAALRERVPSIAETTVYTPDSDPNKLLGRPGQYTSKAAFHDPRVAPADVEFESEPFAVRRGGDIEVFEDASAAQKRADYIGSIVNGPGAGVFGAEYMYVRGGILLRVSGALSPAIAAEYERALGEFT